ncbi:IS200/IS605 family accessory protein TnpB-related protein [Holdemanella porci]|uniref:IS200/IS605 family accessory protein TnpB-related protein n=1 Tax=Holdemanella porci TaxID=2652276 RepID=UPI003F8E3414
MKSLKCLEKENQDMIKTRLKKIDKKIKKNEKQLKKALKKDSSVCFGGKKNLRIDLETFRFKRSRRMLIPGRRQGKYSNNLFKLNVDNEMLTYRSTQKDIVFKVQFHKYKDELYARVNEKHNSPDKAVAYELMDYGEYFIVKAIFEKHMNLPKTDTLYGAVGIDINVDHIALCETNMDGNIVLIKKYPIHKENTKNKRNEELYQLAIEIMEQCKSKKKSLVVEDLNFKQLKTRMLYRPKKQNKTLSSFAYKKILEKVERKCLMNEVDVIKVDPKNTSKIGKEKYTKIKGLSVHYCAAYVINRRGMGFVD